MKHEPIRPIRAVVFRRGERWVAQCLDVDLATSADSFEELQERMRSQIQCQMTLDRRRNREPFSTLNRAPQNFWDLLEDARPLGELEIREPLGARMFHLLHRSREVRLELRQLAPA